MVLEIVWSKDGKQVGSEEQEASLDGAKLYGKNMIDEYAADRVELRSQGYLIWSHCERRKDRRVSWVEAANVFRAQQVDRRV